MDALPNWPRNRLLLALPPRNLNRLMPDLEHIRCQSEQVLMDADSSLDHVFFPNSGVVSVVAVYADGSVIEMATIGREGCTGMQALLRRQGFLCQAFGPNPGQRSQDVAGGLRTGDGVDAVLPKSHVGLYSAASNGAHSLKERAGT